MYNRNNRIVHKYQDLDYYYFGNDFVTVCKQLKLIIVKIVGSVLKMYMTVNFIRCYGIFQSIRLELYGTCYSIFDL